MKFEAEGMFFDAPPPSQDQVFQRIAADLYYSIVMPFASASSTGTITLREQPNSTATRGIIKGLGIEIQPGQQEVGVFRDDRFKDFIAQFAVPIQSIANGRRIPNATKNASLVKPMFDRVSAAIAESSTEAARAIAKANDTPGFWDWVQQHMIAMAASQGEGRGGGR